MTFKKEFKNIIKSSENQELAIKHSIYYLYKKVNKDNSTNELFKDYKNFYIEKFKKMDILLDKILIKYGDEIKNKQPGELYEDITTSKMKKNMGQVYTPQKTINKMIELSELENKNIDDSFKIIDISCGSGYFLIKIIKILKNIGITTNSIIKNNIYGVDKDIFSVFLTKLSIINEYSEVNYKDLNIFNDDILFIENTELRKLKFDLIIGNPPYIGHKNITKEYKKKLYSNYKTFTNKADISFCFFEKADEIIKNNGIVTLITSRYFLEGDNAYQIRKFLNSKFQINEMIDYNGYKLFKNANISPLIIKLTKNASKEDIRYSYKTKNEFSLISFNQNKLCNKKWIIKPQEELNLLRKLYKESNNLIDEYVEFKQGIITGYDKAFVLDKEEAENYNIEKELLKNWIKNSDIKDEEIKKSSKKLIYLKDIEINNFPNTYNHIIQYKNKLEKRRECKKGIIKWYEIQWPREKDIFEKNKIVFPYKASKPKFILDKNKNYCSADIYIAVKKDSDLSYDLLEKYFNSKIFNFICRMELKKVGEGLFEFYPYSLKRLPIINKNYLIDIDLNGYKYYENYLYKILNLTKNEIKIINRHFWRSS